MKVRSLTSNTAPMRLELVSSGQNTRKASPLRVYRSRINSPILRGLSRRSTAGVSTCHLVVAEVRVVDGVVLGVAVRVGAARHAFADRSGWPTAPTRRGRRSRRTVHRDGRTRSQSCRICRCSGFPFTPLSGTWWDRHESTTCTPSTKAGPVQPLATAQDDHGPARLSGRSLGRCGPCPGSP